MKARTCLRGYPPRPYFLLPAAYREIALILGIMQRSERILPLILSCQWVSYNCPDLL